MVNLAVKNLSGAEFRGWSKIPYVKLTLSTWGFRLSCFTPMPLCNSREGFTATWTTTCAVKTVRCLRVLLGTSSALELELGIPITSFTLVAEPNPGQLSLPRVLDLLLL